MMNYVADQHTMSHSDTSGIDGDVDNSNFLVFTLGFYAQLQFDIGTLQ